MIIIILRCAIYLFSAPQNFLKGYNCAEHAFSFCKTPGISTLQQSYRKKVQTKYIFLKCCFWIKVLFPSTGESGFSRVLSTMSKGFLMFQHEIKTIYQFVCNSSLELAEYAKNKAKRRVLGFKRPLTSWKLI